MPRTTAPRHTRTVAVASLVAAAALSLTACQGDGTGARASSPSATANGTGGSGGDIGGKASGSGGSTAVRACAGDRLKAAWSNFEGGPDMEYDEQQTARVVLRNTGPADCVMAGFPGVQLRAATGETWDLRRTDDKPRTVRLDAGGRATFDITFLASTRDDDRKFKPAQVLVTPPNERRSIPLDWPYGGELLDQAAATHPGTFVGPVNPPE
ncbi:DUF4232 domain-containing protein [Streptomyces sp. NBRC 110028]|uniref:DUF4232 domain-containing protein n=1 Tax=Streptomyces sp. NBRC 110028 TaxID=1621260 RepID=UPI0006E34D1B|nr:DUF4232 domain-containing protein [Streptomyces sp. NBRC 110028]